MSEDVDTELETRFTRLGHEFEKLISDRLPSLERRMESLETKTNKLLGFYNSLEEKMMEIDRKLTRLSLENKT